MNEFYLLQQSLDTKIVGGAYPQGAIRFTKESEMIRDKWQNHVYKSEKMPNDLPDISFSIAYHAKWTDLLNINGLSSRLTLPVSDKLLEIILSFDLASHQHWKDIRAYKKNIEKKYNLFYCYKNSLELLDYKKCSFNFSYLKTAIAPVNVSSAEEYINLRNRVWQGEFQNLKTKSGRNVSGLTCTIPILKENIPFDFFKIQGIGYSGSYVSERLKVAIEKAGCTGMEFLPLDKAEYLMFK